MTTILNMFAGNVHNNEPMTNPGYSSKKSTSLTQGDKFIKYQKKIKNKSKVKESFTSNSEYSGFDSYILSDETKKLLNFSQKLTNPSAAGKISEYDKQYKSALGNLEFQETGGSLAINEYYARINPKNPYLNTNISFSDGTIAYVTNQGIVKYYPSTEIYQATAGLNGCPSSKKVKPLNIPWLSEYTSPNITIPTNPPLLTGTPMTQGQSCGYEGTNVYVNTLLNKKVTSQYQGCYADNAITPAMTYIGGTPPEPYSVTISVQNPNFDYPQITGNSFQYINSDNAEWNGSTQVPGWNFNACLINSSEAWGFPMPYPYGSQAAVIQGPAMIGQIFNMTAVGVYILSVYAIGRPSPYASNEISIWCGPSTDNVGLSDPQNYIVGSFTPNQSSWQAYNVSFNITSTGMWNIGFWGGGGAGGGGGNYQGGGGGYYSTAIQNINISMSGVTSGGGGTYTADMCKEYAENNGYQYYAIQDANTSGVGYCAVSNNLIAATQYGESTTLKSLQNVWSSNTQGQPGNIAILNTSGSLVVVNTSGTTVYSTPYDSNYPTNYLGCYADTSTRAFSNAVTNGSVVDSNGPYSWNSSVQSCQQAAQANNMSFFGLQDSNIEGEAVCFIGDGNGTQYGPATNCTQFSDGTVNGGGWSNAVYSTNPGNISYFLSVTDQGLLSICLGQNPNDNQGTIWSIQATPQDANPAYSANFSITGQNWIPSGTALAAGDFVGSPSGYCALIMQQNGNLMFAVFDMVSNCATINGSEVGNFNANAIYALSEVGNLSDIGQVAYIDQNSTLYPYDSTNVGFSTNYTKIVGFDSSGNNLPNFPVANSTLDQCKSTCDSNDECYGFSLINGSCYQKNNQMYPNTQLNINPDSTLYIRNQIPVVAPFGVQSTTSNIDSSQYMNYIQNGQTVTGNGDSINGSGGQFNLINPATSPALQSAENTMNKYATGLNGELNIFNKTDLALQKQASKNVVGVKDGLKDLKKIQKKIKNFNLSTSNILDNSDIVVLQQNYNYMFWSILAIGTVIVSMQISKF
jgi:hypothetical protein